MREIMRTLRVASLLLLVASTLSAQVDTLRGRVGDTLRIPFRSTAPGCWQIQRLTPTRAIIERRVGCWDSVPTPPPVPTPTPVPTPPPSTSTLAFASDWSTVAGNTVTAARDGTRWDGAYNITTPTPDRVTVVAAAGLGFPATMINVLAIRYEASTDRWSGVTKQNGWPVPAIGGVLARRMYFRLSIDGTGGGTHHPVQSAFQAGPCAYPAEWVMNRGPTFTFSIGNLQNGGGASADFHVWQTTLARDSTYRVEELYTRTGATTWKLSVRIYDQSGALIRQDADFRDTYHTSLTLAAQPDIIIPDAACLGHFMIVNQGVGAARGSDNAAANRIYYGGFAVSLSGWIGPYRAGEAR